ncbi:MAG TPA: metallophosphoesterase [Smithellaceae bacterium]|nr:metallophosphoesterase [Smithellaceae bacterium]
MVIFLLTFILLYGGIHVYALIRADSIFHFTAAAKVIIIVVLLILVFVPFLVRIAEGRHLETLARTIAYGGYLWMAFIFMFFFLQVSFDILCFFVKYFPGGRAIARLNEIAWWTLTFLAMILVVYGFIDAARVRVVNIEMRTDYVLPGDGKVRIVQISDVHVGLIIQERRIKLVLDKVKEANPDILTCTGDLLDGELDNVLPLADLFHEVRPRFGKYAVTGNHEYYAGIDRALEFTRRAGFEVLRDETRRVAGINIIGIDDVAGRKFGAIKENSPPAKSLPVSSESGFILLLKHQPVVNGHDKFDLQLSGHTHAGQLIPFRLFTWLLFPQDYGLYPLAENKLLYVSAGTGTWGPPVRIFAPPEITVIDLVGQKGN